MRTNRFLPAALNAVGVLAVSVGLLGCTAFAAPSAGAAATAQALSGRPSPTLAPSPTQAPASTPTQVPTAAPVPSLIPVPEGDSTPGSPLQAGARYVTPDPFPVRVSFIAPAGWAGNIGGPNAVWMGPAATGNDLSFQLNLKVFKDPCHPERGAVALPPTPTVDALVSALTDLRGLADTTPRSTTLAGLPATTFRLRLEGPLGACTNATHVLWQLPLGATNELQVGMLEHVWIVGVNGLPLVITGVDTGDASATTQQAIQQVLSSLRIEPMS
jgi:hypothetical protein